MKLTNSIKIFLASILFFFQLNAFAITKNSVTIKSGGTLIYLEQQKHTNLYPPIGFYPNNGIINQIADRLTFQNPKTRAIEPWVAESWQINADATEYLFKIRPNITFSNGEPVDAKAVATIFDTYGLGNPSLKLPVSEVINNYLKSEVIDPLTVKFYFSQSSPGFLQATSTIGSGLISPTSLALSLDELGDATKIIGSGPFIVESEIIGKSIHFKARSDYQWGPLNSAHQGPAYLDKIELIVMPEDSVRVGSLLSGQADFIRRLEAYTEPQVTDFGYIVYSAPTGGINTMLNIRPDNPLVADVAVRRALIKGTDTQTILDTLYSDSYPKARSIIAQSAPGYTDLSSQLAFDPQQANQLLEAAKWHKAKDGYRYKDGVKLQLSVYEALTQAQNKEMLQMIAQQWKKLGIGLTILSGDSASRTIDELDPTKTPLAMGMIGRADPDVLKSHFYPTNRNRLLQLGGTSNKVNTFTDPQLNQLLEVIATESDTAKRLALVEQVQQYILDNAYVLPIFEEPQVYAGAPYVIGIEFEPSARPTFYNVWLNK